MVRIFALLLASALSGTACAQQDFRQTYAQELGSPMDGRFRPSHVAGTEEAYLPPIDPSAHAVNLLELRNGDVLCFWFSGEWEGKSGVAIAVSRLRKGARQWTTPVKVDSREGESFQNPVGFEAPDGTIWVFHTSQRADAGQADAHVLVVKSHDGGHTWEKPETLFDKPGAFVRQPLLIMPDGRWMLPMYYTPSHGITEGAESNYSVVKLSSDRGATWTECSVPNSNGYVQPSVVLVKGTYIAFFRSRFSDNIFRSSSRDGCRWSEPVKTPLPNNNASIQALLLKSGRIAMVFNNARASNVNGKPVAGPRKPMSVAESTDEGLTWTAPRDLETGRSELPPDRPLAKSPGREEYSYPAIVQQRDGKIVVAFTFRRETIKVMSFREFWITAK